MPGSDAIAFTFSRRSKSGAIAESFVKSSRRLIIMGQ
jgi:hypothetical protein